MFQAVLPLSKYLKVKNIRIYDTAFSLHSKVTMVILIVCTMLVSARQYFGQPIECISEDKNVEYVNLFCWTMGSFIIAAPNGSMETQNGAAVGVGPEYNGSTRIYVRYYQWVVIILVLQAGMFYFPSFLWKVWEGGCLDQLCNRFEHNKILLDNDHKDKRSTLSKVFSKCYNGMHRSYAKSYFICEVLNLAICILNLTLMNAFFNGFWSSYSEAMKQILCNDWKQWNDKSSIVFPKVTKCEFFKFGGSGSRSKYDALCVLPINVLNEKIFAFLYIWFLFLLIVSSAHLTFRFIVLCSTSARTILLQCKVGSNQKKIVRLLVQNLSYSQWFFLMRINSNVNPVLFTDILIDLYEYQKMKNIEISI